MKISFSSPPPSEEEALKTWTVTARVKNGRLVLDEPTTLPEGTELELSLYDPGDDLSEEERADLLAHLDESLAQLEAGEVLSLEEAFALLGWKLP
jgi:hypothetical protein